jgi:hypothetical protein
MSEEKFVGKALALKEYLSTGGWRKSAISVSRITMTMHMFHYK